MFLGCGVAPEVNCPAGRHPHQIRPQPSVQTPDTLINPNMSEIMSVNYKQDDYCIQGNASHLRQAQTPVLPADDDPLVVTNVWVVVVWTTLALVRSPKAESLLCSGRHG